MRLILLPIALFVIFGIFLFSENPFFLTDNTQNAVELAIAKEHDGTNAFYEQVKQGKGSWIENAGTPIFDNQYLYCPQNKFTNTMRLW